MANEELDCKGMNCPMPIVHISKRMRKMDVGDVLSVEADDPSFNADVHAWVRRMKQEMVEFGDDGAKQRAVIRKVV